MTLEDKIEADIHAAVRRITIPSNLAQVKELAERLARQEQGTAAAIKELVDGVADAIKTESEGNGCDG